MISPNVLATSCFLFQYPQTHHLLSSHPRARANANAQRNDWVRTTQLETLATATARTALHTHTSTPVAITAAMYAAAMRSKSYLS